jgi:hypothetical protein
MSVVLDGKLSEKKGTGSIRPLDIRSTVAEFVQSPASFRKTFALSVFSQVNSGSLRPKWP